MAGPPVTPCSRCSHPLRPEFRFCPECALPQSGDSVLSTQIQEVRLRAEERRRPEWARLMLPSAAASMLLFVGAVGWLVFSPGNVADMLADEAPTESAVRLRLGPARVVWQPEWVGIPNSDAWVGAPQREVLVGIPRFEISKFEVPNGPWLDFLREERERLVEREMWREAFPGDRCEEWSLDAEGRPLLQAGDEQLPVRNVSAGAAILFCNWLTRKLDVQDVRVRLPHIGEWELAARGNSEQRFPWGDDFFPRRQPGEGEASRGPVFGLNVRDPFIVTAIRDDVSPFGVNAMGSNVSEWLLQAALVPIPDDPEELRRMQFVLPNLDNDFIPRQVSVRGANFRDRVHFDPTPYALTEEELRLVPELKHELYRKSPAKYLPSEVRDLSDDEAALTKRINAAGQAWAEAKVKLQDLALSPPPTQPTAEDWLELERRKAAQDREVSERGWDYLELVFVRARLRDRLQDWSGAGGDYSTFLVQQLTLEPRGGSPAAERGAAPRERPSAKDVASERVEKVQPNAATMTRASAWYSRDTDSFQKFDTTGFRIVRVTRSR